MHTAKLCSLLSSVDKREEARRCTAELAALARNVSAKAKRFQNHCESIERDHRAPSTIIPPGHMTSILLSSVRAAGSQVISYPGSRMSTTAARPPGAAGAAHAQAVHCLIVPVELSSFLPVFIKGPQRGVDSGFPTCPCVMQKCGSMKHHEPGTIRGWH